MRAVVRRALVFAPIGMTLLACFGGDDTECVPQGCDDLGAACGTASDGCGGTVECGGCPDTHECGAGSSPNQCFCAPRTCADARANCGEIADGCGGTVECGGCGLAAECGGGGTANVCGIAEEDRLCRESGLCWENPLPLGFDGFGVAARADDDAWVVGARGVTLHWDGARWSFVDSGTDADLIDVFAPEEDTVFAVGGDTILRWDGTRWAPETLPDETSSLRSVHGTSAENVWAVGSGSAVRLDEGAWIDAQSEAPPALAHVWVGRTAWASGSEGRLYEFRNGAFERTFDDDEYTIGGLYGRGSDEVYAVGSEDVGEVDFDPFDPIFNPYDYRGVVFAGSTWATTVYDDVDGFSGIFGNDEQLVAADYDDGHLVTLVGTPAPSTLPNSAGFRDGASATPARLFLVDAAGGIARFDDEAWKSDVFGSHATFVAASSAGAHLFLATADGTFVRVGGGVIGLNSASATLADLHAIADDDIWAVGDEHTVRHYDGRAVSAIDAPREGDLLRAVTALDDDVFIAGTGIYRRTGETWEREHGAEGDVFYDLFTIDDAIVAGGARYVSTSETNAVVATRRDGEWTETLVPGASRFYGVHGVAPDDLYAVGDRVEYGSFGTMASHAIVSHFDGHTWTTTELDLPVGTTLRAVLATAAGDVWAVGDPGIVVRHRDDAWAEVDSFGLGSAMNALGALDGDVVIAGQGGAVLRMR